jgi:hypothetical protein
MVEDRSSSCMEGSMPHDMNSYMGGNTLWTVLAVVLVVFLVVAIIRMVPKK